MRWMIVPLALAVAAPAVAASATRDELLAQRRERLKQKWELQFRAADTDQSRGLTVEEMKTARLPDALVDRFARIDADTSGEVTPEELWAMEQNRLDAQARRPGRPQ